MGKANKRGARSEARVLARWGRGQWRRAQNAAAEVAAAEASGRSEPSGAAGGSAPSASAAVRPAPSASPAAGSPAAEQDAGSSAPAEWPWVPPQYWAHSDEAEWLLNEVHLTLAWRLHSGYADYAAGSAAYCLAKRREGGVKLLGARKEHWWADPDLNGTLRTYLREHPRDGFTGGTSRWT